MSKNCIITTVKSKIKGNATSYIEKENEIFIPVSKKFTLNQTRAMAQDKVNKINKEYLSEKFGEVVSLNSSYTDGTGINIHPSQRLVDAYEVKEGNKTLEEINSNRDLEYFNGDEALLEQEQNEDNLIQKELDDLVEQTNNIEENAITTSEIKQGVSELFESNPELANSVYEALGFKNKLKTSLGKELEYKDPYVSKSRLKNFKKYEVLDENNKNIGTVVIEYRGDKSVILHPKLNVIGKGYGKDLYKIVASTFDVEIQEWSEGLIDNSISAKKMWDSLEKEGVAKRVFDTEQGDNFRVLKINSQITPQQKQQALQLYSQYLDTIFPDSKVKGINYHGTEYQQKFEKFDSRLSGTQTREGLQTKGFWFTYQRDVAEDFGSNVISVLLNVKTPYRAEAKLSELNVRTFPDQVESVNKAINEGYDSAFVDVLENLESGQGTTELVVFEPEQIHILGSKQDIEGFKEFVNNNNQKTEDYFSNEINKIQEESKIIENSLKEYETSKKIDNRNTTKAIKNKEEKAKEISNKLLSLGFEFINENEYQFSTSSYITFKSKLNSLEGIDVSINTFKSPDYLIKIKIKPLKNNFDLQKQGELPFNPIELKLALKENDFIQDIADNTFEGLTEEQIKILRDNLENGELNLNCKI